MFALAFVPFLVISRSDDFAWASDSATRSTLYNATAGTAAALLGFVLTAFAIVMTLPARDRFAKLQEHARWPRVPASFFRAARALLTCLVLSLGGVAIDTDVLAQRRWYEGAVVAALLISLVRVFATLAVLDGVLAVNRADGGE